MIAARCWKPAFGPLALMSGDEQFHAWAEIAYSIAPDDPNVMDTLGWVLLKQGDEKRALKYLQDAIDKDLNNKEMQHTTPA